MSPLKELEPGVNKSVRPLPRERATGIQAWLRRHREGHYSLSKIFVDLEGVEFFEGSYYKTLSELAGRIRERRMEEGDIEEIGLPEIFSPKSILVSRRSSGDSYQATIEIPGVAELQSQGTLFQVCEDTVDLLCLPERFVGRVVLPRKHSLLLRIKSRWFEMVSDPAINPLLEVARFYVEPDPRKLPVISLRKMKDEASKNQALQGGRRIFVVARDIFPPFKRAKPGLSEDVLLEEEAQREEENRYFIQFCKTNGIIDRALRASFREAASYYREERAMPHAETTHYWKLAEIITAAIEARVINYWDFKSMQEKLQEGKGDPNDFWTDGVIRDFTTWLKEKQLPSAFEDSESLLGEEILMPKEEVSLPEEKVVDVDAREMLPAPERVEPEPEEKLLPEEVALSEHRALNREERQCFKDFCEQYGIVDELLQAHFLKVAFCFRKKLFTPSPEKTHYFNLISAIIRAEGAGAINSQELAEKRFKGNPNDFWTPRVIEDFTTWLKEKHLPQAFQESESA